MPFSEDMKEQQRLLNKLEAAGELPRVDPAPRPLDPRPAAAGQPPPQMEGVVFEEGTGNIADLELSGQATTELLAKIVDLLERLPRELADELRLG